ncbi:hypothetical protein LAZ67_18002363 [Cordylochernes scorpioides]|uniref:HD domain-containing protein n=1 Tax=Cordylochernes scorpioides TaxID=51811 RepID=A0ABY6LHG9_9ARAC|nr:hypothetical protein LAZ67_18002363 [Cordylochernes scorpioides]
MCGQELKRTGWVKREVPAPESVAEHMYRAGALSMLLDCPGLDRNKCVKMALVHDMAESIIGDITPHCGVSPEVKKEREMVRAPSTPTSIYHRSTSLEDNTQSQGIL